MTMLSKFGSWAHSHRWIWSALAVLLFWGVLSTVTNRFSVASLSGIFLSASFLTVAGIGQMFVVTTGRGNIDLSIPWCSRLTRTSPCSRCEAKTRICAWCACGAWRGIGRRLVQRCSGRSPEGSRNHRHSRDWLRSRDSDAPSELVHSRICGKPDF